MALLIIILTILAMPYQAYIITPITSANSFRPSIRISNLNSSTFLSPLLPMQPLARHLGFTQEPRERNYEEDIGNIDYTGPGLGGEDYEVDLRRMRSLLRLENEYYGDELEEDEYLTGVDSYGEPFYPSLPLPPPANPNVQDVDIVVKSLPGAGPRLTGAPISFPPTRQAVYYPEYSSHHKWQAVSPACDDKIEPACVATVPGFPGCLEDDDYPTTAVRLALYQDNTLAKKWAQQPDTREQGDININYGRYTGDYNLQHWDNYDGFLCPSQVEFVQPVRLRNTEGLCRVILNNIHVYSQTFRIESCLVEGGPCRLLPPCYSTTCTQLHTFHRLLSYNPCSPGDGLFIDTFRLPSGCSCSISGGTVK